MDRFIQSAVLVAASLSALVLFCVGIRQIRFRGKPGTFLVAVWVALGFLCSAKQPATAQDGSGRFTRRVEKYPESRVLDLHKTAEWKNFKAFWKKLDMVTPKKKAEGLSGPVLEYYGSINREEADTLRAELKAVAEGLKRLESSQLLYPEETALFVSLCGERIEQMSGFPMSMMTRMLPPPYLLRREESIGSLERRIDELLALRNKDRISQEECAAALRNIQKDVAAFSAYDAVTKGSLGYSPLFGEKAKSPEDGYFLIDRLMKEYEAQYMEILEARKKNPQPQQSGTVKNELDVKYADTMDSLKKLKRAMPFINEAVLDLEG